MKEIDGPLDIPLSAFPQIELNLEQANDYKAKLYYNLSSKSIVKTADNYAWHIAFASDSISANKVIMNYALGKSAWGMTKRDTLWSRTLSLAELEAEKPVYANHYDSFANLFQNDAGYVYYLYYGINLSSKKFQILNRTSTDITFRFANLNGSNEVTKTVSLNPNLNYNYVSLVDGTVQDIEPADNQSWDFEVTRYTTFVTDFSQPQMYAVGGFISNPAKGLEISKLENVNIEDVSVSALPALAYSQKLNAIGYDWKKFSNGGPDGFYTIYPRTYIVKVNGSSYGIQFVGYTKNVNNLPVNGFPTFLLRNF